MLTEVVSAVLCNINYLVHRILSKFHSRELETFTNIVSKTLMSF